MNHEHDDIDRMIDTLDRWLLRTSILATVLGLTAIAIKIIGGM